MSDNIDSDCMQEKKESIRKPGGLFLVLLFGFFYLNVRLVIECLVRYSQVGSYALPFIKDIPYAVGIFNALTAFSILLAIVSICLALAGRASSIKGLRRTSAYLFITVFIVPFFRSSVMYAMAAFLLLFYLYMLSSVYLIKLYPKEERKHSFIGKAAMSAIILLLVFFLLVFVCRNERARRSQPYDIETVSVAENEVADGYIRFGFPEEWQKDSLVYDEERFPITFCHSADSSSAWVHSYVTLKKDRASHNSMAAIMSPIDESEISRQAKSLDTLIRRCPVFYSEYELNEDWRWSIATMYDRKSYKATSVSVLFRAWNAITPDSVFRILETIDFKLDGELLEEQSI